MPYRLAQATPPTAFHSRKLFHSMWIAPDISATKVRRMAMNRPTKTTLPPCSLNR